MVLKNILEEKELTDLLGAPLKRDELLIERFCFDYGQLEDIRSYKRNEQRIDLAAQLLLKNIRENNLVKRKDEGAQITTITLAAIIEKDWYRRKIHTNRTSKAIRRLVGNPKDIVTGRLIPPATHFLREKYDAYHGNLFEAERVYPNFSATPFDWQNSVTIPLDMGFNECLLLGVLGFIAYKPLNRPGLIRLNMKKLTRKGKNDPNYQFLETISSFIRNQYNIIAESKIEDKPIDVENGLETNQKKVMECIEFLGNGPVISYYLTPYLQFSSKAIKSWITQDLGLGGDPEKVFEVFKERTQLEGLFAGGISRTNINYRGGSAVFSLRLKNQFYMSMMSKLGTELGYPIAPPNSRKLLIQNRALVWDLYRRGHYLHPMHRMEIGNYHQPNIPSWELGQETLGGKISYLRNQAHLSQVRFADLLGVTPTSVENWEADKNTPRENILDKITVYFNLPKDRLIK